MIVAEQKEEGEEQRTWQRRLGEAKLKHRPTMKDWGREGFSKKRAADLAHLTDQRAYEFCKNIDRVHCDHMSEKDFVRRYEEPTLPVVIAGVPARQGWSAVGTWTDWEWLHTSLGERLFKVGEDDDGYKVKVKFKYFMRYLRENEDDSPLYVFDSTFDDDNVASCLLSGYNIPAYFRDDLFSLVGEKRRPPYRWFLCGPRRSGTCTHIDPLGTSAWNTLLVGRKRWVLFPPSCKKRVAKALDFVFKGEDDEAVNYFVDHLPRLLRRMRQHERTWSLRREGGSDSSGHTSRNMSSGSSDSDSDDSSTDHIRDPLEVYGCSSDQVIEFTQYPGETVFVPGDWWHAVLNLDDTVAVTQNFCSITNFPKVWRATRVGRKKMACKWLAQLRAKYPDLATQADEMNEKDNFLMYYEARALKEKKRKEKEEAKERKRANKENKESKKKSEASAEKKTAEASAACVDDPVEMTERERHSQFKHESKHDGERRLAKQAKRKLEATASTGANESGDDSEGRASDVSGISGLTMNSTSGESSDSFKKKKNKTSRL